MRFIAILGILGCLAFSPSSYAVDHSQLSPEARAFEESLREAEDVLETSVGQLVEDLRVAQDETGKNAAWSRFLAADGAYRQAVEAETIENNMLNRYVYVRLIEGGLGPWLYQTVISSQEALKPAAHEDLSLTLRFMAPPGSHPNTGFLRGIADNAELSGIWQTAFQQTFSTDPTGIRITRETVQAWRAAGVLPWVNSLRAPTGATVAQLMAFGTIPSGRWRGDVDNEAVYALVADNPNLLLTPDRNGLCALLGLAKQWAGDVLGGGGFGYAYASAAAAGAAASAAIYDTDGDDEGAFRRHRGGAAPYDVAGSDGGGDDGGDRDEDGDDDSGPPLSLGEAAVWMPDFVRQVAAASFGPQHISFGDWLASLANPDEPPLDFLSRVGRHHPVLRQHTILSATTEDHQYRFGNISMAQYLQNITAEVRNISPALFDAIENTPYGLRFATDPDEFLRLALAFVHEKRQRGWSGGGGGGGGGRGGGCSASSSGSGGLSHWNSDFYNANTAFWHQDWGFAPYSAADKAQAARAWASLVGHYERFGGFDQPSTRGGYYGGGGGGGGGGYYPPRKLIVFEEGTSTAIKVLVMVNSGALRGYDVNENSLRTSIVVNGGVFGIDFVRSPNRSEWSVYRDTFEVMADYYYGYRGGGGGGGGGDHGGLSGLLGSLQKDLTLGMGYGSPLGDREAALFKSHQENVFIAVAGIVAKREARDRPRPLVDDAAACGGGAAADDGAVCSTSAMAPRYPHNWRPVVELKDAYFDTIGEYISLPGAEVRHRHEWMESQWGDD
jgi:hypothetical protein